MLDHVAIHVGDPQRAVRAGTRHYRTAPTVLAGKEIVPLLALGPVCLEAGTLYGQHLVLNQIVKRLANEGVRFVGRPEQPIVAIDRPAASGSKPARLMKVVIPFLRRARRKHLRTPGADQMPDRLRRRDVRVSRQVAIVDDIVPKRVGVLGAEPIAPCVAVASELCGARFRSELPRVGAEAKVTAPDREPLSGSPASDFGAAAVTGVVPAVGTVHPTVEPPPKAVDAELLVAFMKSLDQHLANVGPAVPVGIA